ncbi:LOW QUALITY PROTEIN: conserved hypothetical protein, partial [Brucella pinnipedialis M163/99/10]
PGAAQARGHQSCFAASLGGYCRPGHRRVLATACILWPRRIREDDPFTPATLVIACEGFAALQIQHETGEIISRVNGFLGFAAIGRIRIKQKPPVIAVKRRVKRLASLGPAEERSVDKATAGIEDDALRQALARLGRNILAEKRMLGKKGGSKN